MTENLKKTEDKHWDKNQIKWVTLTNCGKEVQYITKLFKGTNDKITVRLNRLSWFGHVQRMEENRIHKRVLYMNLGTTRLRGRQRNR